MILLITIIWDSLGAAWKQAHTPTLKAMSDLLQWGRGDCRSCSCKGMDLLPHRLDRSLVLPRNSLEWMHVSWSLNRISLRDFKHTFLKIWISHLYIVLIEDLGSSLAPPPCSFRIPSSFLPKILKQGHQLLNRIQCHPHILEQQGEISYLVWQKASNQLNLSWSHDLKDMTWDDHTMLLVLASAHIKFSSILEHGPENVDLGTPLVAQQTLLHVESV